jgi:hypothetical protein
VSKELQTIDTFIEQQQSLITELTQTVMLLQTKVKMLEEDNKALRRINSENLDENGNIIIRKGVQSFVDPTISKRVMDPVPQRTTIQGLDTRKGIPRG